MAVIKECIKSKYKNNIRILFTVSSDDAIISLDIGLLVVLLTLKGVRNIKKINDTITRITGR